MEGEYVPTIGLEIHAELRTRTKMFCDSKNDPDETRPNVNVCPVCLAHPGTLPVINREAVRHVLKVGIALGSQLADYTEFDRKNYFYPDLPKGYQLSQFEYPLVSGGELAGVAITRVHLEEDTASSIHDDATGATAIDYNRSGVPLMELVTEPVITSAEQAGNFARELQLLLRTLGASNANMEKGEMRVEANVSVGKNGELGTKVEIKNLNSFNAMERAVRYEIDRQKKVIERGEKVLQQTLGWDDAKQATFPQRSKEGSADYRYFPDPDLPSLKLSELPAFNSSTIREEMPEVPWEQRARYQALGVKPDDAETFIREPALAALFESAVEAMGKEDKGVQLAANYIGNDLVNILSTIASARGGTGSDGGAMAGRRDTQQRDTGMITEIPISSHNFNEIITLVRDGKISSRTAKDLLAIYANGELSAPDLYVKEHDLLQSDIAEKLEETIQKILSQNLPAVAEFKAGKTTVIEYLVGQCMRELRGAANPAVLRAGIEEAIAKL
jgi:aspartyl-tRNA(Asn)/glutamyl-tRNA(Gln) amidotransferase subunit B